MVSWSALLDAIVTPSITENSSDSHDTPQIYRSGPPYDRPSRQLLVDAMPSSVNALRYMKELGGYNVEMRDG